MPTPAATLTFGDVWSDVTRQFGDESGVQIVQADVQRWVNQAQREIVNKNPMIQATADQTVVKGQQRYALPTGLLQIESVMYDTSILDPKGFEDIRSQVGIDNNNSGTPLYWYLWANQIYLWPVPNDTTGSKVISVNYSSMPRNVSALSDTLGVPDRYYDRVLEFVMSKAYELDEDWSAHDIQTRKFESNMLEVSNADKNMVGAWWVATDSDYE